MESMSTPTPNLFLGAIPLWYEESMPANARERAVQEFAGHGDIRTTRRYTQASVPIRLAETMAKVQAKLRAESRAGRKERKPQR